MKNFNSTLALPKKGRPASSDVEAFKEALKKWSGCLEDLDRKDFSIEFDSENTSYGSFSYNCDDEDDIISKIRYVEINGISIPFIPGCAGGDWEIPVCFIIYLNKKGRLRGYVPHRGNLFNPLTNTAFGNDCDKDDICAHRFGFAGLEDLYAVPYDEDGMIEAIKARLIP